MASNFSVSSFIAAIDKSGARSNLFQVTIGKPTAEGLGFAGGGGGLSYNSDNTDKWQFLVNATTLPGYNNAEIPLTYFGRTTYLSGDTTFGDWTVTVLNDEDMKLRKDVELWMEQINSTITNVRSAGLKHSNIVTTAEIKTFGLGGPETEGVTKVKLFDLWPSNISPIDLSQDASNTIETFQVTWQYNYSEHSDSSQTDTNQFNTGLPGQ